MYKRQVQGEQIGQNITAFLRTQSKQDRLLFMKRYWYGVSIKDLAQQMQISESSAKAVSYTHLDVYKRQEECL